MKKIRLLLSMVLFVPALSSCSLFAALEQSKVEEFGDVHFYDSGMIGCIDWLEDGDTMYYYVSSYEGDVAFGEALGAFNTSTLGEKHSYTLYALEWEEYKGIAVLVEKMKLSTIKWLYASEEADSIPTSMLFDIPHKDDWLSGGQNFKINDVTYSSYGSTKSIDQIEKGNEVGTYKDTLYYEVVGYPDWICSQNKTGSEYFDLAYKITMTELPFKMVRLVKEIV